MKRFLSIFLCFCFLVLCACQPTPNAEAVVGMNDQQAAIAAEAAPESNAYTVPERWQETMMLKNATIVFDAELEIPSAEHYPVGILEKHKFTNKEFEAVISNFLGNPIETRPAGTSREELLEDLEVAIRGYYLGDDEETGEPIFGSYPGQEEEIADLQQRLEELGDSSIWQSIDSDAYALPNNSAFRGEENQVIYATGYTNYLLLSAYRNGVLQPESWVLQGEAVPGEKPHALENVEISAEAAQLQADALLQKLDLTSMSLATVEKARIVLPSNETASEGWNLTYALNDGNLHPIQMGLYSSGGILLFSTEDSYAETWQPTMITVYVDNSGVELFCWSNPLDQTGIANANARLIPFEDVQEAIRKLLKYALSWTDSQTNTDSQMQVTVSRVVLSNCIQPIKDDATHAYLLPAWIVFLTSDYYQDNPQVTVFAVNALDGSLIHMKGY
ncbi:MAG TPA: DUF6034 family protein [Candidatus Cryosericum sp.]|nr:DUF6034 family protein [Candidatus Cryosericum sp.]